MSCLPGLYVNLSKILLWRRRCGSDEIILSIESHTLLNDALVQRVLRGQTGEGRGVPSLMQD